MFSQIVTNAVNFFLDDAQREAREDVIRLSRLRTPAAYDKVTAYIKEAISFVTDSA
jgi:hypothetical protein